MNPWADELTFTADRPRTRRDHEKYLTLIDAIALLHQYQRPMECSPDNSRPSMAPTSPTQLRQGFLAQTPSENVAANEGCFIRVTLDDIALANRLAPELLGRALDELPPQTRRVYEMVKVLVREKCDGGAMGQRFAFFSRVEVRRRLGWNTTQIRFHLERLRELEYVAARYGRPGSAYQYELLADCRKSQEAAHIGLLDVEKLRLRQATCRGKRAPVGGCRETTRQGQDVEEPYLALNLSAGQEFASGQLAAEAAS